MSPAGAHWSLTVGDLERLDAALTAFVADSGARCALLVERGGRSIAAAGRTASLDQTAFASLAAADFAASGELARLLGEPDFPLLYHAGQPESMYLADVGGQAILAALFGAGTTLGLVRLRGRATIPALSAVLQEVSARPAGLRGAGVDDAWFSAAADEIDRLFN